MGDDGSYQSTTRRTRAKRPRCPLRQSRESSKALANGLHADALKGVNERERRVREVVAKQHLRTLSGVMACAMLALPGLAAALLFGCSALGKPNFVVSRSLEFETLTNFGCSPVNLLTVSASPLRNGSSLAPFEKRISRFSGVISLASLALLLTLTPWTVIPFYTSA